MSWIFPYRLSEESAIFMMVIKRLLSFIHDALMTFSFLRAEEFTFH